MTRSLLVTSTEFKGDVRSTIGSGSCIKSSDRGTSFAMMNSTINTVARIRLTKLEMLQLYSHSESFKYGPCTSKLKDHTPNSSVVLLEWCSYEL